MSSWPCVALPRADLSTRTTLRVGGSVEWLLEPADPMELADALKACVEQGIVPRILGGGANLLIQDGLLPGVVIATERMRRLFRPVLGAEGEGKTYEFDAKVPPANVAPAAPEEDPRLVVWAGCTLPALLRAARDLGFSGLERLVGVPGSLGGGVAMNAGAGPQGPCMWDVIESVRVLSPTGEFEDLSREECRPSYRNGGLEDRIVAGAVLRFEPSHKGLIQEAMSDYLQAKNKVQPVTEPSAGCIFKNPDPEFSEGRSAGQLVQESGARGLTQGGAAVSERHGNFIVNRGGATAADVFTLMEAVRQQVLDGTGVDLEYEVKRWRVDDRTALESPS